MIRSRGRVFPAFAVPVAVALAFAQGPVGAEPRYRTGAAPSLVATRADPAVTRAVAEAAAALPVPAQAAGAADVPDPAFLAVARSRRTCSPLEAAAKFAIAASCVRYLQCTYAPGPPAARPVPPDCDIVRAKP